METERATRERAGPARPAARRRLSGEQRRASLLDAGARVFAERGFDAARIEEIAQAAGVSKALIYEHFPSKRDLYAEIVKNGTDAALGRVAEAAAPGLAGVELLEAALGAFLDFVAERPYVWRVITQDVTDPTIIALDESMRRKAVAAIAALVGADPVAREQLDPTAREQMAEMINGATIAIVNWWLENPSVSRERVASNLMGFLWLGLERTRSGQRLDAPSGAGGRLDPNT
jgi:AcrR family transcriptional regulator